MTTTKTAEQAIQAITKQAEQHSDEPRMLRTAAPIRQGDLYLIPCEWPGENGLERSEDRQLAPGSTKGSRHCAEGEVDVWYAPKRDALTGPIVRAFKRWILRHPEHADVSMPSGCYQVAYQRDREREEIARVMD